MKKTKFRGFQVQLTTYMPPELKERLDKISRKSQIPMNRILKNGVEKEIQRMEKKWN